MIAWALLLIILVWIFTRSRENFDTSQLTGHSFELKGQEGLHKTGGGNFYFYFKKPLG